MHHFSVLTCRAKRQEADVVRAIRRKVLLVTEMPSRYARQCSSIQALLVTGVCRSTCLKGVSRHFKARSLFLTSWSYVPRRMPEALNIIEDVDCLVDLHAYCYCNNLFMQTVLFSRPEGGAIPSEQLGAHYPDEISKRPGLHHHPPFYARVYHQPQSQPLFQQHN